MNDLFDIILGSHSAVVGKTGAGKSSTAKLLVEHAAKLNGRVCVLDPIKSDWWGLISSSDGKRAGLPFDILGGPRGHVPLHSASGKAIAEVVASGDLPLSVVDMADFEPGGQARFFVDFAPALLRKMRGVVYLVIEEAHLFAPKERSGLGSENMAIHWAKTLATAGRSKGIRLIVLTQRTQALHNAILGSCETLLAHRLSAPADQEPIMKWLKANCPKDVAETVASSLSSLKTGEAWVCSGEAKVFEKKMFPKIKTYDNTATPTNDSGAHDVKTAAIDKDKLRSLIGEAVKEAEANDPKLLKAKIADLEKQLAKAPVATKTIKEPALRDGELGDIFKIIEKVGSLVTDLKSATVPIGEAIGKVSRGAMSIPSSTTIPPQSSAKRSSTPAKAAEGSISSSTARGELTPSELAVLDAVASFPSGATRQRIAVFSGRSIDSSSFQGAFPKLVARSLIASGNGVYVATESGREIANPTEGADLDDWLRKLNPSEAKVLKAICDKYPAAVTRAEVSEVTGQSANSSSFQAAFPALRALGLIEGASDFKANDELMRTQ